MTRSLVVAKLIADAVVNVVKVFEDQDRSAVTLKGVVRSIQVDGHSCGVHSVYVILRYYCKCVSVIRLQRMLGTDEDGTSVEAIRSVLRKEGLTTRILPNARLKDLRKAINQGHPLLVSTEAGEHWAVVYGYSTGYLFVCDSALKRGLRCRIPTSDFLLEWDRWAMVV